LNLPVPNRAHGACVITSVNLKIMKWMLALSAVSLLIFSCGKKCPCESEPILPAYVAYAPGEIDTIVVRRFVKGSNFSQRIDSVMLTSANARYTAAGDTTVIALANGTLRVIENNDWQIFNPFDNKLITISEISIEKQETHCGGIFSMDRQPCFSPVSSFKKNGVTSTLDQSKTFRGLIIRK
jgi:hypothetical protein